MRIPIYGDVTRTKLAEKHKYEIEKGQNDKKSRHGIHYDISQAVYGSQASAKKESLNTIMFDILILNAINQNAGCQYYFEK